MYTFLFVFEWLCDHKLSKQPNCDMKNEYSYLIVFAACKVYIQQSLLYACTVGLRLCEIGCHKLLLLFLQIEEERKSFPNSSPIFFLIKNSSMSKYSNSSYVRSFLPFFHSLCIACQSISRLRLYNSGN